MSKTEITCGCGCGRKKMVRDADIKRGWGKFFSKSCKARKQSKDCGGRKYTFETLVNAFHCGKVSEEYVAWVTLRQYQDKEKRLLEETGIDVNSHIEAFDTHPFSSDALGQW